MTINGNDTKFTGSGQGIVGGGTNDVTVENNTVFAVADEGIKISGSGNITDSVTLPSGASIVYTVIGTVSPSATAAFTNTATVTPPGGTPLNAPDTDNPIVLSIIKTDSAGGSSVTNAKGNVLPAACICVFFIA